jgi:hypothetical protein
LRKASKSRVYNQVLFCIFLSITLLFIFNTICTIRIQLKNSIDIDKYLPKETLDWYILQLSIYNIDLNTLNSSNTILGSLQVYIQAYLYLKDIVQHYYNSSTTSYLQKLSKPIGRYQAAINQERELSRLIQDNTEFVQRQKNWEFVNSIEDLLILERENPSIFQDIENNSSYNYIEKSVLGNRGYLFI